MLQEFEISKFCTSIPLLNFMELVEPCFIKKKNDQRIYKHLP